jgi:hypothetical protein
MTNNIAVFLHSLSRAPCVTESLLGYLNCALGCLISARARIEVLEMSAEPIRELLPKMQRIWGNSALAKQGRDKTIKKNLQVVDDELQLVKEGKKTKQDRIGSGDAFDW